MKALTAGLAVAIGASVLLLAACQPKEAAPAREPESSKSSAGPSVAREPAAKASNNSSCTKCHTTFVNEMISRKHARHQVFCVNCHGSSDQHMAGPATAKPEKMFARADVASFCGQCHKPEKHPQKKMEAFLEKWRGKQRPNGREITAASICTDCHGEHVKSHKAPEESSHLKAPQDEWIRLFNGKDLTGWKATGNAKWTVEGNALVGVQGDNNAAGDLLTEASYSDFEFSATYRVDWPANSGIWFRYQAPAKAYQADILEWPNPECYSGTIYCSGKMFIAQNTDKKLVNRDGWNTIIVRAEGEHIQAWINGRQVADVHDNSSDSGHIGIQVHPGKEFGRMKITISELKLKPLPKAVGKR